MPDSDKRREKASMLRGVMLSAAVGARSEFINWSQYTVGYTELYDRYIGRGLCQGLSAKYLDCVKNGRDFVKVVDRESLHIQSQYERTDLQREIFEASVAGNIFGGDRDRLAEFMVDTYGFRLVKHDSFRPRFIGSAAQRFADFVTKPGFFMVSVPGHALAACCSGRYHFFDPNCGITRSSSRSRMRKFITSFFRSDYTKRLYGRGQSITFDVTRLM